MISKLRIWPKKDAKGKTDYEVTFPGVDVGGKAKLHYFDKKRLIVKVAGYSAWAGLGRDRTYEPALFYTFERQDPEDDVVHSHYPTTHRVKFLFAFPVKGL